jgi:hypothetical protein
MSFWMQVLIIVTLIVLCWGGGFGIYRGVPNNGGLWPGTILGILGLILFIVLVIMFVGGGGEGVHIPRSSILEINQCCYC